MKGELLVIEDSDEDFEILSILLREIDQELAVKRLEDGYDALEYLKVCSPSTLPRLILIDLNLPDMDGRELIKQIKILPSLSHLPVVVLSTSDNPKDVRDSYKNGANAFLTKPVDLGLFRTRVESLLNFWFLHNVSAEISC